MPIEDSEITVTDTVTDTELLIEGINIKITYVSESVEITLTYIYNICGDAILLNLAR
jgi:hypothetical protein